MKIKYFSWVKDITKVESEDINDSTIKDINNLKLYICIKYPKMKIYIERKNVIRFAINYENVTKNKKISLTDEIAIFPPVSGG